jgi:DNA-binding transcriptional MocR family regulator
MGTRENTRAYWRNVRDNLQMYAKDFGMPYDPGMELPHWKDAAKASGLSERDYANAYQQLKRQGRVS